MNSEKYKAQIERLKERVEKLTATNRDLRERNKKLRSENKVLKAELKLIKEKTKTSVRKNGAVVKVKVGAWKQICEDYPLLTKSYYLCVKKYGWVVRNHYHLAGYLRKMVEGDPKEGIPAQMSADRLARRYAFLAAIPDKWWNGKVLFGPPPKTEAKGQTRINELNNLISTNPDVKSFWKRFSKHWKEELESS